MNYKTMMGFGDKPKKKKSVKEVVVKPSITDNLKEETVIDVARRIVKNKQYEKYKSIKV